MLDKSGHQVALKLKPSGPKHFAGQKVPYFQIYDLQSTYATRLSAGGVADQWVTQLQMKREALEKIDRRANEMPVNSGTAMWQNPVGKHARWQVAYNDMHVGSGRSAAW